MFFFLLIVFFSIYYFGVIGRTVVMHTRPIMRTSAVRSNTKKYPSMNLCVCVCGLCLQTHIRFQKLMIQDNPWPQGWFFLFSLVLAFLDLSRPSKFGLAEPCIHRLSAFVKIVVVVVVVVGWWWYVGNQCLCEYQRLASNIAA